MKFSFLCFLKYLTNGGFSQGEWFDVYDRKELARKLLTPIIEKEVAQREVIHSLTSGQVISGIRSVLEEISDNYKGDESDPEFAW